MAPVAGATPIPTERSDTAGAAIFLERCAICHGRDGHGGVVYAGSIAGVGMPITKRMVLRGSRKMKPVRGLDEAAADAVARYVAFLE